MTDTFSELKQEVFISLKLDTRKGRRANIIKPDDHFANTHLAKLLGKAYLLENRLLQSAQETTLNQFCKLNNISPRYLRSLLSLNNLSPRIKKAIVDGTLKQTLSVQELTSAKFPLLWNEQEKKIFNER
ncbi:hypothetical protein FACS189449_06510 [Alphaproteobacteria bacterium]|nr:hypothetical protein FACS189449_06510 [Alphaproteobacteria bacterium]